jgi:hypothetical protein
MNKTKIQCPNCGVIIDKEVGNEYEKHLKDSPDCKDVVVKWLLSFPTLKDMKEIL